MVVVKRTVTEVALTTDGFQLQGDDMVCIKVNNQFILTRYKGLEKGYFATENIDGDKVKYRMSSITACYKVKNLVMYGDDEEE